jgi:erythromycin esterase
MVRTARTFALTLVLLSVIVAQGQESQAATALDPADAQVVEQWLAQHAISLRGVEAGQGFADLAPLQNVLKDARIVALGEATHGTREFFQFKHRMLEFLVTQMHFNVFAIEASFPACQRINDYVLYGRGDRAMALAGQGFRVWDTEEVRDLIEWLRQYNAKLPEKQRVRFIGFDMQRYPYAFKVINAYLKKTAPEKVPDAEAAFEPLRFDQDEIMKFTQTAQRDKLVPPLDALIAWFDANRTQLGKKSSKEEFEVVRQNARILQQFVDVFTGKLSASKRDEYMAENVRWIVDTLGPDTRIVLWAHNAHIGRALQAPGFPSMGSFLRKTYGQAYYALGFTFNQGSFQAREIKPDGGIGGMKEFKIGAAPEGSVGWYFAKTAEQAHMRDLLVIFRSAPADGPVGQWLSTPQLMYFIGGAYSESVKPEQSLSPKILRDEFDGLIYIAQTTRARPNPTAINRPPRPEE